MTTNFLQTSPCAHAQSKNVAKWSAFNGMNIASVFASGSVEQARQQVLGITDVSCFTRYGVKGSQAAQWLADRGVAIPANPNSWTLNDQQTLVLRLGGSEFLLEDQFNGTTCSRLSADAARGNGLYPVPRADAAFIIAGSQALNLFAELCALDLREKTLSAKDLIMTQVAGISATLLRQTLDNKPVYRLWCDGTYGAYMWQVLEEIAVELGGGAVGMAQYQA